MRGWWRNGSRRHGDTLSAHQETSLAGVRSLWPQLTSHTTRKRAHQGQGCELLLRVNHWRPPLSSQVLEATCSAPVAQ